MILNNSIALDKFPIDDLQKVADLIYFEGPLLVWFETKTGDDYLFYWCDSDEQLNRWFVCRVENVKIIDYINRNITLMELILEIRDGFAYIVDVNGGGEFINTYLIRVTDFPKEYTPSVDSYYEFEPEFASERRSLANRTKYRVSIGRQWSLEDLYVFPQKYSVAYSFIYSLRELNRDYIPSSRVKRAYADYPWKGGFSAVNFFQDLNADVLKQHRPQVTSLQYASPGWIEIELLIPVAEMLKLIIDATVRNSEELERYYKSTYSFLREHKITGREVKEEDLQEDLLPTIELRYTTIAKLMEFQFMDRVIEFTKDRVIILKIMLSFYRRARDLAHYQLEGKATL